MIEALRCRAWLAILLGTAVIYSLFDLCIWVVRFDRSLDSIGQ